MVLLAFYLIMNVAVGGTNGWFPDGADSGTTKKPWLNGAISAYLSVCVHASVTNRSHLDAMQQFAQGQDVWSHNWPKSEDDRALRMYVVFFFCLATCVVLTLVKPATT